MKSLGLFHPIHWSGNLLKFPSVHLRRRVGKPNGFWLVSFDCQRAGTPRPAGRTADKPQFYASTSEKSSAQIASKQKARKLQNSPGRPFPPHFSASIFRCPRAPSRFTPGISSVPSRLEVSPIAGVTSTGQIRPTLAAACAASALPGRSLMRHSTVATALSPTRYRAKLKFQPQAVWRET